MTVVIVNENILNKNTLNLLVIYLIFNQLQRNLLIEDNANDYITNLDTFKYFCKLANITCKWNQFTTTSRENRMKIRKIMKEANVYSTWDNIVDVTNNEMQLINTNICNNNETFQMRLEYEMYI